MRPSDVPVVTPPAELTAAADEAFDRVCTEHLDRGVPGIVLDLQGVAFVSSGGLGWLVKAGQASSEKGSRLVLARGPRGIVRLLRTVGIDAVIPHFATVEEATAFVLEQEEGPTRDE